MDNEDDEYLLSTIKVEYVDVQGTPDNEETNDFVDIRCDASTSAETYPANSIASIPTTSTDTSTNEASEVVTQCKMKNCTWTTTAQDARVIYFKLIFHARMDHKQITDICETCFQMFDSKETIQQHICWYQCHFCTSKSNTEIEFVNHIRKEHNFYDLLQYNHQILWLELMKNDDESNDDCQICDCKFFNAKMLNHHLSTFHLVTVDINMDFVNFNGPVIRNLVCNACSAHFTNCTALKQHYFKVHKTLIPMLQGTVQKETIKYWCNLCALGCQPLHYRMLEDHYFYEHNKRLDLTEFDLSKWHTTIITELCNQEGKLKFSCQKCSDFYSTSNDLKKHKVEKHGEHLCGKCNVRLDSEIALKIHMEEVHFGECKFCDFKTFSFVGLHVHVLNQHKDSFDLLDFRSIYKVLVPKDDAYHICTMCQRSLTSAKNMKMHYFWFHKRYFCDYCKLIFSASNSESEHYSSNHLTDCIHCSQKFTDSKTLDSHLVSNHLNEKYCICEFCGENLKSRDELLEHRTKHESKNFSKIHDYLCSECGQQFKRKNSYELHVKNKHTKNDMITNDFCKVCSKKFKNITLHMFKTHGAPAQEKMTEMEHRCKICEKIFCNFGRLKKHLKSHSKYKCGQCSMQFNLMVNLEQHVSELHTNRYAYSCTVCTKIFSTESDFNLHMNFHQGAESKADLLPVLRCELCDEFSLNRAAMQRHVKRRHIKNGKLINVKRKKPSGRPPYIKRIEKNSVCTVTQE